ncbi:hypothetical protein [Dongia rigui]|uniref:Anti-sigma factor n=1 Tax=Dongia rigui TaxID=940149 RepID=A0ABU5E290_9PROT|nr:hypothetical protein [Dongia rigui]MDY0873018.1 hypothetical protein [Dongia rigui]
MTARKDDTRPLSLEDAQELLPWYLTGKLGRAENDAIDDMLKGSADLRDQLQTAQSQQAAVLESNDNIGGPSAANLTKLLQQIETTKQRRYVVAGEPGFFERLLGSWAAPRPALQFALAAACALIIAQGAFLYQLGAFSPKADGASYATASDGTQPAIAAASLIVSFRPEVTAAQLTQMLGEIDATVIDGPKPGQTFVLGLADAAAADAAIAKLQSRPDLVASAQRR